MTTPTTVIDLQEGRNWDYCPMCGRWQRLDHAVGWYEEAVLADIGSTIALPNGEAAEVCGMPVCHRCHDDLYELDGG